MLDRGQQVYWSLYYSVLPSLNKCIVIIITRSESVFLSIKPMITVTLQNQLDFNIFFMNIFLNLFFHHNDKVIAGDVCAHQLTVSSRGSSLGILFSYSRRIRQVQARSCTGSNLTYYPASKV